MWISDDATVITNVVAWQPLPEFYVDPNVPNKGDYGIFDGEKWVNMRTDIPIEFNVNKFDEPLFINRPYTKEEAESKLKILKGLYDDLLSFSDRIDRINHQLLYYLERLSTILNPDEST
jgi:hypothetical protein